MDWRQDIIWTNDDTAWVFTHVCVTRQKWVNFRWPSIGPISREISSVILDNVHLSKKHYLKLLINKEPLRNEKPAMCRLMAWYREVIEHNNIQVRRRPSSSSVYFRNPHWSVLISSDGKDLARGVVQIWYIFFFLPPRSLWKAAPVIRINEKVLSEIRRTEIDTEISENLVCL